MATAGLFALIDDIMMSVKLTASKTLGVIGDDLAVNAEKVQGIRAHREIPVLLKLMFFSFINKLILIPLIMPLAIWAPGLMVPILMLGGAYLCFEGAEKVFAPFLHAKKEAQHHQEIAEVVEEHLDMLAFERKTIRGAVTTDFILSAEIMMIALSQVIADPLLKQILVLLAIAAGLTIGVYLFVMLIVRLDDIGLWVYNRSTSSRGKWIGKKIVGAMPSIMKGLTVVGTLAVFFVGGEFIVKGIAPLHHGIEHLSNHSTVKEYVLTMLSGFTTGSLLAFIMLGIEKLRGKE